MKTFLTALVLLLSPILALAGDELPVAKITAEFIHTAEPDDKVIYVAAGDPIELMATDSVGADKFRWKVSPATTTEGAATFKTSSPKGIGPDCQIYSRPGYYIVKLIVSNDQGPDMAERKIYVYTKGEYPKPPAPFDPVVPNPIIPVPTPKPVVPTPFDPDPVVPVPVVPTPDIPPATPLSVKVKAAFGTAGREDAKKTAAVLRQISSVAVSDTDQKTTTDLLVVARGALRRLGVELKNYPTFEPILREAFIKVSKEDKQLTVATRAMIGEVCNLLAKACDDAGN